MTLGDPGAPGAAVAQPPLGRAKLRVGVLLCSRALTAWEHAMLTKLADSTYARLVVVGLPSAAAAPAGKPHEARGGGVLTDALRRIVARLDRNMVCEIDAFAAVDGATLLSGIESVEVDAAADSLLRFNLDVLVDLSQKALTRHLAAFARYGVWRVAELHRTPEAAAEGAFWPLYRGLPLAEAVLERYGADGNRGVIARALPITNPFSVKLSASAAAWGAASLVPQKLAQLYQLGPEALAEIAPAPESTSTAVAGPTQLAGYIARNVTRRARASLERRLMADQWILLFRLGEDLCTDPSAFTKLIPPKDRFWADPHVLERNGRYYAFIEDCPFTTGKGHIAVMSIEPGGTWTAPVAVLERPYHLSYPFVFEEAGELYMVPESGANRTIDLYRCVDFPSGWEHATTLIPDIVATDSTLLKHDGRWWLFTNVIGFPGATSSEELHIFYSDSLTGGTWRPHARNPVVSDARRARPAGRIFERGGSFVRPAQDCSVRYGYAVRLHRIEALNETEYRETEIERIEPHWDGRIRGVHTLSHVPGLTMMDAMQPTLRS